jgi:hypothetical protein
MFDHGGRVEVRRIEIACNKMLSAVPNAFQSGRTRLLQFVVKIPSALSKRDQKYRDGIYLCSPGVSKNLNIVQNSKFGLLLHVNE